MKSLLTSAALVATLLCAMPATALAYYPYTWFTGTSYLVGPGYFVGGGGFSTGPAGMYAQSNYYGNSCGVYGCGTLGVYNPMTGTFSGSGSQYQQYGTQSYTQYGGYAGGCYPYVPSNVCGIISQYGGSQYGY